MFLGFLGRFGHGLFSARSISILIVVFRMREEGFVLLCFCAFSENALCKIFDVL